MSSSDYPFFLFPCPTPYNLRIIFKKKKKAFMYSKPKNFTFQLALNIWSQRISRRLKTQCGRPWWLSGKGSACACRRPGLDPWVKKILWRRKWQPIPVFLPGKFHGERSLVGYSPCGHKESDMTKWLSAHTHY